MNMYGQWSYVHTTAEKFSCSTTLLFWGDLKYLNTFLSFQGLDSFHKDIDRAGDTNSITKDRNWKKEILDEILDKAATKGQKPRLSTQGKQP